MRGDSRQITIKRARKQQKHKKKKEKGQPAKHNTKGKEATEAPLSPPPSLPQGGGAPSCFCLIDCLLPRLRSARRREQREKNSKRPAQRKKREERINKREDSRQITTKWLIRERETTVVYTNNTQARNHQASASAVTKPGPCPCPRSPLPLPLSKKKNNTLKEKKQYRLWGSNPRPMYT
jgi:hypothetical protein